MSIQDVCLSINKLSNDALDYPMSYFVYIIFKLWSMKYNLDKHLNLAMDTLTSIFVCKAFQIRGLILPKLLVLNIGTSFVNMEIIILSCKMIVYLIIGSV